MARRSSVINDTPVMMPNPERFQAVQGIFQMGQMGCVMAGQYADAAAIGLHGDNIANEITGLADKYPQVGKALDALMQAGPFAGLITATLPLVLQIAANHKRIPADKVPGVVPPEVLETQMKAQVATAAAEQARMAKAAQAEYEQAMSDLQGDSEKVGDPVV
jgi:hypothetical protein